MTAFPSQFENAVGLVLQHEGGFVQHPSDPGGATKFGITHATLARARGHPVSVDDVRSLTREEAIAIYRRLYWDAVRAEELPPGLDLAVFDLAVHSGPLRAVRMLQAVLGVEADGIVGPVTLAAARRADVPQAIGRLTSHAPRAFFAASPPGPSSGAAGAGGFSPPSGRLSGSRPFHPPTARIFPMLDTKTIFASRTVWANLIGLAALVLGLFGFDGSALTTGAVEEALVQFLAAGSFIASTVFRILATKQILN